MLERQYGKVVYVCDECGEPLETGEIDFDDALEAFHDAGWLAMRDGNCWAHRCPACEEKD